jgi:hypothetical protein
MEGAADAQTPHPDARRAHRRTRAQAGGMTLADFQTAGRTRLMQADANRDGALDKGEIDTLLARRFARMDANGDGTPAEIMAEIERYGVEAAAAIDRLKTLLS